MIYSTRSSTGVEETDSEQGALGSDSELDQGHVKKMEVHSDLRQDCSAMSRSGQRSRKNSLKRERGMEKRRDQDIPGRRRMV